MTRFTKNVTRSSGKVSKVRLRGRELKKAQDKARTTRRASDISRSISRAPVSKVTTKEGLTVFRRFDPVTGVVIESSTGTPSAQVQSVKGKTTLVATGGKNVRLTFTPGRNKKLDVSGRAQIPKGRVVKRVDKKTKKTTLISGILGGETITRVISKASQKAPRRKSITADRFFTVKSKTKIKAKIVPDISFKGLGKSISKTVGKANLFLEETGISKVILPGVTKTNFDQKVTADQRKQFQTKINQIRSKKVLTTKDKRNLFILKAGLGATNLKEVGEEIRDDFYKKPIQNAALFGLGVGFQRIVGASTLKIVQLGSKSPVLAKSLTTGGKLAGATVLGLYIDGVRKEAQKELADTGRFTKTTADTIRELILLGAGGRIGATSPKAIKTSKLTQLQKMINKAPKSQKALLQNKFDKLVKLDPKLFVGKDVGILTKLESQQLRKVIRGTEITKGKFTVTKDKIFFVKKTPTKAKKFNMKITSLVKQKKGKLSISKAIQQDVVAKFNSKTGRIEIIKVNKQKTLSPKDAQSFFTRIKKGQTTITKTKSTFVRASQRKLKPGVKKGNELVVDRVNPLTGKREKFSIKRLDQPVKRVADVRPTTRKTKEVLSITSKLKEEALLINTKGDSFFLAEFKVSPTKIKPKLTKPIKIPKGKPRKFKIVRNKVTKKFELVETRAKKTKKVFEITVGKKGKVTTKQLIKRDIPKSVRSDALRLIKKDPKLISKTITSKPIISVESAKGKVKIKVLPLKSKTKISTIKSSATIGVTKPRKVIFKPIVKPQAKITPKIKPTQVIKPASGVLPTTKPTTKAKPKSKPKTVVEQVQDQAQLPQQVTIGVQKTKLKASLRVKPVLQKIKLPLIPFFKLPKKKGKVKVKKAKSIKKPIKIQFTPTITGSGKRRPKKKELELLQFTGAELR